MEVILKHSSADGIPRLRDLKYGECCLYDGKILMRVQSKQKNVTIEVITKQSTPVFKMLDVKTGEFILLPPFMECHPVDAVVSIRS